jgi:hypothetical protein
VVRSSARPTRFGTDAEAESQAAVRAGSSDEMATCGMGGEAPGEVSI